MKVFLGLIVCINFLLSNTNITYDRNNLFLENSLHKIVSDIPSLSLKPVINESKALYELGKLSTVSLSTTTQTILNGIYQNTPKKLLNYTLLSSLRKEVVYIIVNKSSPYKTIYDLNNRNISINQENSAMDLFTLSLTSSLGLTFNKYYEDTKTAVSNMLQRNGLDAVIFSGSLPSSIIEKYKEYIRLINIPNMESFQSTIIGKDIYRQKEDTRTIQSNILLIGKNEYIKENPEVVNQLINKILENINTSFNCTFKVPIIQSYSYLNQMCQNILKDSTSAISKTRKKTKVILNLVKEINSVEDIEIYVGSLFKNTTIGGLSKKTELKKLTKVIQYYTQEKSLESEIKIIIKSYANNASGYRGGKKIFKLLQKKGVSRGNMIIKSFNTKKICKEENSEECQYLENKVTFEFL